MAICMILSYRFSSVVSSTGEQVLEMWIDGIMELEGMATMLQALAILCADPTFFLTSCFGRSYDRKELFSGHQNSDY